MSINQILMTENVEKQYNLRKSLYENRDIFYNINASIDIIEDDPTYKELNDNVVKGKKVLTETILEYNNVMDNNKRLIDIINQSKKSIYEIQEKLDYLKLSIDTNLNDTTDQITYLLLNINESIDNELKIKKDANDIKLNKLKSTLKTLSDAYGIIRNTTINTATCPICMHNQVELFFKPCGHLSCKNCVPKTNTICYFCRSLVDKVGKLYDP